MLISKEEIKKLARLSRLTLTDEEIASYQEELAEILAYVKKLDEVDVESLSPTYQVTGLTSQDPGATRPDTVEDQVTYEQLMKNVPNVKGKEIQVKRMIG